MRCSTEAIDYLADARMDQWRREAEDIDINQSIIMFPAKFEDRTGFHQAVLNISAEMGNEFRELSDGNKTATSRLSRRVAQRAVKAACPRHHT
jgi:hypothetical protein